MRKKGLSTIFFLLFLVLVSSFLSKRLYQRAAADSLGKVDLESSRFRDMEFTGQAVSVLASKSREAGMAVSELLTVLLPFEGKRFRSVGWPAADFVRWKRICLTFCPEGYRRVRQVYGAVWDDLACFPVPAEGVRYENSWMFERSYGGSRGHEGTDLMPPEDLPGHYQVLSITDGTVENIGWLPQGGWRIGIRSPSGGYFYYAHLHSYSQPYRLGQAVKAGECLGFMGDTGYGEEGASGNFPVHLHLGIYIRTDTSDELSVNPYWVLRYLESLGAEGNS